MTRTTERLIDLAAMTILLGFCFLLREDQPALAGLVVWGALNFWMQKNAESPDVAAIAAKAAAQVLATAQAAAKRRGDDDGAEEFNTAR